MTTTPNDPLPEPTIVPPGEDPGIDPTPPGKPHEDPQTQPNNV